MHAHCVVGELPHARWWTNAGTYECAPSNCLRNA
jgi:hypothetical protein